MNFTPERNPKILELAREASRQIKALGETNQSQVEQIYRNYRLQADTIRRGEVSAKTLARSGADLLPDQTKD